MVLRFPIKGPSVKRMVQELRIYPDRARYIKRKMDEGLPLRALGEADVAMRGYGVESLYPDFPDFYYVNMGDTYATTLYYTGRSFQIGSWGDYVERH